MFKGVTKIKKINDSALNINQKNSHVANTTPFRKSACLKRSNIRGIRPDIRAAAAQ
jgi:hypothetical protein